MYFFKTGIMYKDVRLRIIIFVVCIPNNINDTVLRSSGSSLILIERKWLDHCSYEEMILSIHHGIMKKVSMENINRAF